MAYDFTGVGWDGIDPTRPQGNEMGNVWDDALRQTRMAGKSHYELLHLPGGALKAAIINTDQLVDGCVTWEKLATTVQDAINSGGNPPPGGASGLAYIASVETTFQPVPTYNVEVALGAISLPANTFNAILVTAEVYLRNYTGSTRVWTSLRIKEGATVRTEYDELRVGSNRSQLVALSTIFPGGQSSSVGVSVTTSSDNSSSSSNLIAALKKIRLWGIP